MNEGRSRGSTCAAFDTIEVDPSSGRRAPEGLTWATFDAATQTHALTTGGRVSTTGIAGLTLGGGSGWLERLYGLACDNLIAAELVTASGEHVRASGRWTTRGAAVGAPGRGGNSASSRRSSSSCILSGRWCTEGSRSTTPPTAVLARAFRDFHAGGGPEQAGSPSSI